MNNIVQYKILVVDDQPNNLNLVTSLLRPQYDIYLANNGEKAIAMALELRPHLILLDVMMPGLSGFEVCELLKQNEITAAIPVIFLTANNRGEDYEKAFELGGVDYITKPINAKELLARVKTHLLIRQQQEQLERQNSEIIAKNSILQESEANLKEAQSIARLGRWELDLVINQLHWSDSVFEIFEIDREKFGATYEGFLNAIHPDDRELVSQAYKSSLETKKPYEIEYRLLLADGRIKWLTESCRNDYDADGKVLRSVGVVQDITERKNHEENLRKSNERFEKIAEATNDVIWDWGIENDSLFLGDAFKTLFGRDSEQHTVNLKTWSKHIHPEDFERIIENLHHFIESGKTNFVEEYRYKKADNTFTYVMHKGVIIRDSNGKAIQMVGAISDNPERIRYEQELLSINIKLEKHVEHIEAQNKKLRSIAWTQSHVVRAPLSRILGIINLIETEKENLDDLLFWLSQLRVSCDEMDEIVKKITEEAQEIQLGKDDE